MQILFISIKVVLSPFNGYIFRQRKELAKIEAERSEQSKNKVDQEKRSNRTSLLYTMEEVIYEEIDKEDEEENTKNEVVTDDEIEEQIDQLKSKSFEDNEREVSEASDISEEMFEEQEGEIPEAIEYEEESSKIHIQSNMKSTKIRK